MKRAGQAGHNRGRGCVSSALPCRRVGALWKGWSSLRVLGVDVEPGCGSSGRCFAAALVENGRLAAKYEQVPLHRLIRLVWELRPSIVALDNVYELARNGRELARIATMLPPEVEIVQPTRLPDGSLVDVRRLARLAGLDPGRGKLTPSRTAYLVALLAAMGYGTRLRFVEEKTRIVVAKNRSLGHGGMSSQRYQRRVRAAILRATKDIKRLLDRNGFDYDLVFRKSGGGLESAVFVVYAPRSRLRGVVKPHSDTDVRIEIQPVYSSRLSFEAFGGAQLPGSRKPYIIVGVDPGISTGIAALDLEGRPVLALSRRGIDREEVVELIRSHGVPVLVATDVNPAPDFVRKLAGMLRVPLYVPSASLSVEEKREIFDRYLSLYPGLRRVSDSHVRDALAAAAKAYRAYQSKLRQVESYLNRIGPEIDHEEVKAAVIRGKSVAEAVEKAISDLLASVEESDVEDSKDSRRNGQRAEAQSEAARRVSSERELLKAEIMVLRRRLEELEAEVERLRLENRLLHIEHREELERDRELAALRERLALLRAEIEKLRSHSRELQEAVDALQEALFQVSHGLAVPAPVLQDLAYSVIEPVLGNGYAAGKPLVAVERVNPVTWAAAAQQLRGRLLAVLVPAEHLETARSLEDTLDAPILPLEDYVQTRIGGVVLLDPSAIMDAYIRRQEMEERRRREEEKRRRALTKEKLRSLLEEYRSRRARLFEAKNGEKVIAGGGGEPQGGG